MLAIVGEDAVHRVEGLPGESAPVGLTLALGRLRALGVTGLRVALPAPGHPLGLSGPPEFNARALEAEGRTGAFGRVARRARALFRSYGENVNVRTGSRCSS